MEFKRTGPDVAVIMFRDGSRFLFSYGDPVAIYDPASSGYLRTDRYVSRTTESHIADFVHGGALIVRMPHEEILRMTREAR